MDTGREGVGAEDVGFDGTATGVLRTRAAAGIRGQGEDAAAIGGGVTGGSGCWSTTTCADVARRWAGDGCRGGGTVAGAVRDRRDGLGAWDAEVDGGAADVDVDDAATGDSTSTAFDEPPPPATSRRRSLASGRGDDDDGSDLRDSDAGQTGDGVAGGAAAPTASAAVAAAAAGVVTGSGLGGRATVSAE